MTAIACAAVPDLDVGGLIDPSAEQTLTVIPATGTLRRLEYGRRCADDEPTPDVV